MRYVSISKAAEYLGVSIPTLRRWDAEGMLVAERTPGGRRRYNMDVVEALYGGERDDDASRA